MRGAGLLVLLLVLRGSHCARAPQQGVTNEDIRNSILSLTHVFRENTDKLTRHELREKIDGGRLMEAINAVGDRVSTLEHNTDILAVTLARIDDRLRSIESKLTKDEEKDKAVYTIDTVQQGSMQGLMTSLESMMRNLSTPKGEESTKLRLDAMEAALGARLDTVAAAAERVEAVVLRPTSASVLEEGWLRGALEGQQQELVELKALSSAMSKGIASLPTREEVGNHFNSSQDQLQLAKYEITSGSEKGLLSLQVKVDDCHRSLTAGQEDLQKIVTEHGGLAETFYSEVQKSYEQLLKEVKGLGKVEQVMIQTADNVLDTKRRIEYGTHQILLEIGDLVKLQMKELNTTVNKRFDNISITILANQNGGLTNLSSKIEYEISQVWRQIGIMYQTLTASAQSLDKLQVQTDAYVNGSLQSMGSMEGKVSQITGRMSEVDDHLNYLLGKISLFTQEFNQIKSDLGERLESIKSSFKAVQEQIKDVGPGPNPIHSEENVSDVDNRV